MFHLLKVKSSFGESYLYYYFFFPNNQNFTGKLFSKIRFQPVILKVHTKIHGEIIIIVIIILDMFEVNILFVTLSAFYAFV